jgi:hypothetical protein
MKRILTPELMPMPLKFIDLQLFAEDPKKDPEKDSENDPNKDPAKDPNKDPKKLTQDEVNAIIQKRLATEQAKWEKEFRDKLGEAITEAEKLAKMNAEQKAEYERQKKEAELTQRENEITRRELRAQARETLAEKGLPKQLADVLVYTDAKSTSESIEAVEKAFRDTVEAGVNERLKGNPPKNPKGAPAGDKNPWSREHFNLTEQGKILKENPEKAKQLQAVATK